MNSIQLWSCLAAGCGGVIAAVTDIRDRKVYNWLTYPLFAAGLIYHAIFSGWGGFTASLAGAVFGFGVILVPCLMGGVGPGDVKLLAGVGAWLRFPGIVCVFILAGLAVGVWSVGIILVRTMSLRAVREQVEGTILRLWRFNDYVAVGQAMESSTKERWRVIPFAVFVAGAVGVYAGLLFAGQLPQWSWPVG